MIGVLIDTCKWEQKQTMDSKYPEANHSEPVTLQCFKDKDKNKPIQTETGVQYRDIEFFLLHTSVVKDGDLLDGKVVAIHVLTDFGKTIQGYKAVVQE